MNNKNYKRKKIKSFTLLELVIVVILVGILASLATPLYRRASEGSHNKEAQAMLNLIGEAEKMYNLEYGQYFGCASIAQCNRELKLNLPASAARAWDFNVQSPTANTFTANASRQGIDNRVWSLDEDDQEPACNGQPYCKY